MDANKDYIFPSWYIQTRKAIYYILGVIEVLLGFRLIFKLLGANAGNGLVNALYTMTKGLIAPFIGIFSIFAKRSTAISVVFEPAVILAMIVYAVIALGIVNLIRLKIVE